MTNKVNDNLGLFDKDSYLTTTLDKLQLKMERECMAPIDCLIKAMGEDSDAKETIERFY